ncbi:MAG: hypothetical protein ACKV1O_01345 [Saprospiraceae bacterium]
MKANIYFLFIFFVALGCKDLHPVKVQEQRQIKCEIGTQHHDWYGLSNYIAWDLMTKIYIEIEEYRDENQTIPKTNQRNNLIFLLNMGLKKDSIVFNDSISRYFYIYKNGERFNIQDIKYDSLICAPGSPFYRIPLTIPILQAVLAPVKFVHKKKWKEKKNVCGGAQGRCMV